jgi:tetratricopeptide (TPR) repeat protein
MKGALLVAAAALAWSGQAQQNPVLEAARAWMVDQNDEWYDDGEYLIVVQNLRTLCEEDPSDEDRWSDLVWMLGNVEDYAGQVAASARYRELNPDKADAAYYLAQFYFLRRAYARIPELMEPVVRSQPPPHPNCFRFLTNSYQRMGFFEDALRVVEEHIKAYPQDVTARAKRDGLERQLAERRMNSTTGAKP